MIDNLRFHDTALSFVADTRNMICSATLCNDREMTDDQAIPEASHERLEWARRRSGYESASDFARAAGIHATTYRAYENGQNGFAKLAPTFAKKLGVPIEWLLGQGKPIRLDMMPPPPPQDIQPEQPPIRGASDSDGAITIRSVDLSYSMGDGANLEDYFEEQGMQFDPNFLRTVTRANANCLFVARGDGDSMFPTLLNDDQVLIDTSQRKLNQQDRIWACAVHGAGMIKRLRVIGEGRIEIRSDNPAVGHREISADELHIVGRVVWIGRRV